ncbi:uncharacterized protein LOC106013649 [Aplysia californica]|uniref:Uncharacterized protein LOC106013649 n=1 Tax=Aplysia californica TaxID=6500 RepID=A0ABM1AD20_APLCA|nr:uncharacterized protein LOC106013649 [Aplysia californica]
MVGGLVYCIRILKGSQVQLGFSPWITFPGFLLLAMGASMVSFSSRTVFFPVDTIGDEKDPDLSDSPTGELPGSTASIEMKRVEDNSNKKPDRDTGTSSAKN